MAGPESFGRLNSIGTINNLVSQGIAFFTFSGVPTSGVTFAGKAGKGSICIDITTGTWYFNAGTKASPIWTAIGSGGGGGLSSSSVLITNAQILTLPTTPVQVVAAPGAGKYLVPIMGVIEKDWVLGIGSYGNITDSSLNQGSTDFVITYGDNDFNAFRPLPIPTLAFGGLRMVINCAPVQFISDPVVVTDQLFAQGYDFGGGTPIENKAFKLASDNAGGNFTGGDAGNKFVVTVYYQTRTFGSLT